MGDGRSATLSDSVLWLTRLKLWLLLRNLDHTLAMASPKGFVLHEGESPFDGRLIVSIATLHSSNRKTGDMVQVWILPKDINPLDAVK